MGHVSSSLSEKVPFRGPFYKGACRTTLGAAEGDPNLENYPCSLYIRMEGPGESGVSVVGFPKPLTPKPYILNPNPKPYTLNPKP